MAVPFLHRKESPDQLGQRVEELRSGLREKDPYQLSRRTGAFFQPDGPGGGEFQLELWGAAVRIAFPGLVARRAGEGQALDVLDQALLAYYFSTSDGTPPAGRWIAFSELPDGRFYAQAFQGYSGNEIAKSYRDDLDRLRDAAAALGGRPETGLGQAAFSFQALPYVALLLAVWQGDEEFPASYRVLFDESCSRHLSTDACAILGSQLARRLVKMNSSMRSC